MVQRHCGCNLPKLNLIDNLDDHLVAIFGADHIYRMNVREMIDFHERMHADVSVAAIPVSAHLASEFGVIEAASDGAIVAFHEKKSEAPTIPGEPHLVYASMGNYIFSARILLRELEADALRTE
jgi:glucose-1-phosphate adenylyltransferase